MFAAAPAAEIIKVDARRMKRNRFMQRNPVCWSHWRRSLGHIA
jgi:hypothetical protein